MRWVAFTTSAVLAIVLFNFRLAPIAAIYLALAAYNATQGLWPKAGEIAFQVLAGAVAAGGIYGGATLGGPESMAMGLLAALPGLLTLFSVYQPQLQALAGGRGWAGRTRRRGGEGPVRVERVVLEERAVDFTALEEALKRRVLGQDHAVEAVVRGLKRKAAGLSRKEKPYSAMLAGPTGTGKTELAKALAEALGRPLVRYDMNQYGQDHTVAALVGSPPGYVGSDRPGRLYEDLARHPKGVFLFDEMEKAHPAVLDPLLQLLDEGRFQELSKGLVASAPECILLFTTNLLAREAFEGRGEMPDHLLRGELVQMGLRPEFVNRLDTVVAFRPFGEEELLRLARLHLKRYLEDWKRQVGTRAEVKVDEGVYPLILSQVDARFGARDLQRAIESLVADPLAEAYLAHGGKPRRVEVAREGGKLVVHLE
mgnify:CR=1 FL=1